jgi:peptidoglycan/LPS O-acetylase OafA/YrhL
MPQQSNIEFHQNIKDRVSRNANLDLLRAAAIFLVLIHHSIQMSPITTPAIARFAFYGQHGVDLFFVLSGWLIGRLYWNECEHFGRVELFRFWARRWLRTIPPYLVALAIAWSAVYFARREPFDLGYLLFLQNYYTEIPFFSVSWSLCVEEHFYLAAPLLLLLVPQNKLSLTYLVCVLFFTAPLSRVLKSMDASTSEFFVASLQFPTHVRMEGLILGFALAYLSVFNPKYFEYISRYAVWCAIGAAVAFVGLQYLPAVWNYRAGFSVLSVGLASILLIFISMKQSQFASSRIVRGVAVASYSIYLTHALMIHIARATVDRMPSSYGFLYFPIAICLVGLASVAFYQAVESTSIKLRDAWVSRRTGLQATASAS